MISGLSQTIEAEHARKPKPAFRTKEWLINEISRQRKWIEDCEANGQSYTGSNGQAIREADEQALKDLEEQLHQCN